MFFDKAWHENKINSENDVVKTLENMSADFRYWNKHVFKNILKIKR